MMHHLCEISFVSFLLILYSAILKCNTLPPSLKFQILTSHFNNIRSFRIKCRLPKQAAILMPYITKIYLEQHFQLFPSCDN